MTALEKLNALQAGELDKVFNEYMLIMLDAESPAAKLDAAKVEVSKAVLPVIEAALLPYAQLGGPFLDGTDADPKCVEALAILQQLKESL